MMSEQDLQFVTSLPSYRIGQAGSFARYISAVETDIPGLDHSFSRPGGIHHRPYHSRVQRWMMEGIEYRRVYGTGNDLVQPMYGYMVAPASHILVALNST